MRFKHFLVDIKSAIEKELTAAAEADDGVVERNAGLASTGDDFLG